MDVSISNAQIVTTDAVVHGSLNTTSGQIGVVTENGSATGLPEHDWQGDYLIPGLIDIHTDNLEKHFMPRNNSPWDSVGAAVAHDGQVISAGVTTVFDSLSAHGQKGGFHRNEIFGQLISGLSEADHSSMLKADHLLHIRCEVTNPELRNVVEQLAEHPKLKLLSVMKPRSHTS